jgi:arylsulfatase A
VYEGGLRVPLIVRWPGVVSANKVSDSPITQLDYVPTLLEACGVKTEDAFDGQSVLSLFKGDKPEERTLYWHFPHYTNQGSRPAGAMRDGRWKLIEHYEDGSAELYDLNEDASEENDLAKREPERVATMKSKLAAWRKQIKAQENTINPAFDAAMHKKLYIDTDVSKQKATRTAAETRVATQAWRDGMNAVVPKKKKAK